MLVWHRAEIKRSVDQVFVIPREGVLPGNETVEK